MSDQGTLVFARIIEPVTGREFWQRLQFLEDEAEAVVKCAEYLKLVDCREILSVDAAAMRTWRPGVTVEEVLSPAKGKAS